jgi:hypothetical protein
MSITYFLVVFVVTFLLLSLVFFPFCKVHRRIKTYHPDLWVSRGPFDAVSMMAHGQRVTDFFKLANTVHADTTRAQQDPDLARWSLRCSQMSEMAPKTFFMQVAYLIGFLYFVMLFTGLILG